MGSMGGAGSHFKAPLAHSLLPWMLLARTHRFDERRSLDFGIDEEVDFAMFDQVGAGRKLQLRWIQTGSKAREQSSWISSSRLLGAGCTILEASSLIPHLFLLLLASLTGQGVPRGRDPGALHCRPPPRSQGGGQDRLGGLGAAAAADQQGEGGGRSGGRQQLRRRQGAVHEGARRLEQRRASGLRCARRGSGRLLLAG